MSDNVEFMTKVKFSKLVETTVLSHKLSYMDSILHLCEKYGIEPEDCRKYVSNVIKEKLEFEAMQLNYFAKPNELPI
jgi:hypothetical protein